MREVSKQLLIPGMDSASNQAGGSASTANASPAPIMVNPTDLFFDNFESSVRISYLNQ